MVDVLKAVETAGGLASRLLSDYKDEIKEAYLKAGDGSLTVSLNIKLSPKKEDIEAEVGISFVAERVKESVKAIVSNQTEIFKD